MTRINDWLIRELLGEPSPGAGYDMPQKIVGAVMTNLHGRSALQMDNIDEDVMREMGSSLASAVRDTLAGRVQWVG